MTINGTSGGLTDIQIDELDELFDVQITSPSNGQTLAYQNGLWVNSSAAGGGSGTVTSVSAGGGLDASTNPITGAGDIFIANTAVSAGSYTLASITVNSRGQITAASNGAAGSGTVTSAGIAGNNGIGVAGSPINTEGVITLSLGNITPTSVSTGIVSASNVNASGDILAATGRVIASAATINNKLTGNTAAFSGVVSADAGLRATIVSADSVNTTGDVRAATGRVTASAATFTALLTGATASFSGLVSADGGINTQNVSATTGSFSGVVSANAGLFSTTGKFSGLLTGATATFSGKVSADAGINTTTVSAASIGITGDLNAASGRIFASAATFSAVVSGVNFVTPITSIAFNGTTATDATLGSYFRGTAVSAFTLSNPTGAYDGQKIIWEIIQDATGNRNITLGNKFAVGTDITAVTLASAANTRSFVGAFYNATADKFYVTALARGY